MLPMKDIFRSLVLLALVGRVVCPEAATETTGLAEAAVQTDGVDAGAGAAGDGAAGAGNCQL